MQSTETVPVLIQGKGTGKPVAKEETQEIIVKAPVKCKPGQGKLNRTIVQAQALIEKNGHVKRRFKRNYADGTATYTCDCGAIAVVKTDKTIEGSALTTTCTSVNEG